MGDSAATEPMIELSIRSDNVVVDYQNVSEITVNFYVCFECQIESFFVGNVFD